MSWVTAIWAVLIGGCIALALPHLIVGIWLRRGANLLFVLASSAVIGIAAAEMVMMRSTSVEQFAVAQQWAHVPIFILVVALVGFVYLLFGTGRLWLGLTVCVVRFVALVINFMFPPSLNFREINALRPLPFWGETVSVPIGVINPWTRLGELTSLLLLIYVLDASLSLWHKNKPEARRRAVIVGGSIVLFILIAATMTALIHRGIIAAPYMVSFPFAAILVAIAAELGFDLLRAEEVKRRLKVSESSLRESEERFRIMADAAPVMMWMTGQDKLCTFLNKAWLEFTGRNLEHGLGNGWIAGVHPDDYGQCWTTYTSSFDARKPFVMQYRLRNRDGEHRWITDQGIPRFDAQKNFRGYVGACLDITDLLKKERTLHEFEERVALAAEAAHLGVWELNIQTNELWISDKACQLFQFEPETAVSYSAFQDRVHPEDRPLRHTAIQRAIETKGGYEIEYRTLLPDGTIRWMGGRGRFVNGENGETARLLGVSMDVTERKEAQELFQLATEASPSGTLLVDEQGCIVLANAHAQQFFGYSREELLGKPVEFLLPDRFGASHGNFRAEFLTKPEARAMGENRELFARRKNGTEFPVEITLNPIKTPRGLLVLASILDLSARKEGEEVARRQRDKIDLLTRVSLLGEMTAFLAHELNQPLAAILSNAIAGMRFIDKGQAAVETLREILADVVTDGRRAYDIIANVRNTIKKGGVTRQSINLNEIVAKAVHLMQTEGADHSCEVKTLLEGNLPTVEADPTQIQQVLINLLGNAFEAMRNAPADRRKVELATKRNGDESVLITVRDYGPGISDDVRKRLFEQFFTTKEDGLGMGLAIVHSIVESHCGKIEAENVEGGGAQFYVTLPMSSAA